MNEFNIDTCKWIIWGAKRPYNTYGHIHEAFLKTLQFLGKEVYWLENGDDISQIDFAGSCFLTMNCAYHGIPQRQDGFYIVHNLDDSCRSHFEGLNSLSFGVHCSLNSYADSVVEVGPEIYFDKGHRSLAFRWGTDLLPHEIAMNKPKQVFNSNSTLINYIGTIDSSNEGAISNFRRAAAENGIGFEGYGGYGVNKPPVSPEEGVRLIKESYMAPALQRLDQIERGYVPCRLFKNISYGQFGITHSKYTNDLFGGRLIYNPDTYQLFYDAKERLQDMKVEELHSLMDEIAAKHTYLNKIDGIAAAVRELEN
jgi:hypothetical protein